MPIRWRRTPRSFLKVSLAVIAVLVVSLGLLGWRLLDQDRALEHERVRERLTYAAELTVASLRQAFSATEARLATLANADNPGRADTTSDFAINDDAVVVVMTPHGTWSSMPLAFYPDEPDPVDAVASRFAEGEQLELTGRNLPDALATFRRLATGVADPQVRAGAWLRVARVARRLEQPGVALAAYDELAQLGSVSAAGRPSDLVASLERCALLDRLQQRVELNTAATAFESGLRTGRWRLSRGQYFAYLDRATQWRANAGASAGSKTRTGTTSEALATGLSLACGDESGMASPAEAASGRETFDADGVPVLILWRRSAGRTAALVATRDYAARTWFRELPGVDERQRALVTLTSDNGQIWLGSSAEATVAVRQSTTETGLPFSLHVATSDPAGDAAMFSGRRRLQTGVLATVVLLLVAGGYVVARGIGKELEVARLQSDFVAAVSHEFRTPVASMLQLSELLDEGRVDDESRRSRYYGLLRRESERLQRLVEGLLDFDRMESSAKQYRFEVLEPGALVTGVADEFAAGTAKGSHRVLVSIAAALPMIHADREALGRAIWNLIDNAAKYSKPDTAIHVDVNVSGHALLIRVRDEGPGIAPEEQHRIFDKFVRGTSARATGAKGTGLGLAMVAHIAKAHGGDVRVDSGPGVGATFTIVLPAAAGLSDAASRGKAVVT